MFQSKCGGLCGSSHRWQGEEGHSDQGEGAGQQPSRPRLGRLVAVADGGQRDLRETSTGAGEDSHAPPQCDGGVITGSEHRNREGPATAGSAVTPT